MRIFIIFFALQFTLFLLVTVNFRAIAQARYGWTILTDALISGAQFWIIRKVGTSAESVLAWSGFVFGGGAGSTAGIWLSKRVFSGPAAEAEAHTTGKNLRFAIKKTITSIANWFQSPQGAAIATWVQSFAVVVSLIFIGYQVQQQTKLSRAANVQASVGLITPLSLKLAEPEMARLLREGSEGFKDLKPDDVRPDQYETLLATYLVFCENTYWQNQQGLLDDEIYRGWDADLRAFIKAQRVKDYWQTRKAKYQPAFRDHVDQIIREQ